MKLRPALIYLFFLILAAQASAESIYCDQCGNRIKEGASYITSGSRTYCDHECYEKSLPKCAVCGKPVKAGYISEGKNYCSEKCLSSTWESCSLCGKKVNKGIHFGSKNGIFYCLDCAGKPVCSACGLPNDCIVLPDGRNICGKCRSSAITSFRESMEIIREVRRIMKNELNIGTDHEIEYRLVDMNALKKISKNQEFELGLYSHEQWKKTEVTTKTRLGIKLGEETSITMSDSFFIYILTDLPKDKFIEIAAHELAHDWMEEQFPNIKEPVISEGWAEYAASLVNSYYSHEYLNKKMKENDNPVYGDGFRLLSKIAENGGKEKVIEFLKEKNSEEK